MKKLWGILLCVPLLAWGQVTTTFQANQILTAQSLNSAFALAAAATNGVLANPTVTGSLTATGLVTVGDLAAQAANTILMNGTGGVASPTAVVVPTGCNTTASALQYSGGVWTCGTVAQAGVNSNITSITGLTTPLGTWAGGLGVNNTSASGVPVFVSGAATVTSVTGSGAPVLGTSPTITTPNLLGVTNGATAGAGQIGQVLQSTGSAVSITSSTLTNCTSLNLTAGDWDVWGNVAFAPGASTALTLGIAGLSTTSVTLPSTSNYSEWANAGTVNFGQTASMPMQVFNVASTTTVYAVAETGFASGSATMNCVINARRIH